MKKQVLAIMAITLIVGAFLYQNQEASSPAFEQWKAQYGVNWGAEQQLYRRMIFERNVAKIEAHNADPSQTYKMGVNQFTILTQQEFVSTYLTTLIPDTQPITEQDQSSFVVNQNIDWVDQGKVSPIKNQGQCGSCWAFSTTGVIESAYKMNGTSVRLSEQQLVDCSGEYGNQGCNGGWPQSALKYVIAKGIASQSEYPYTAKTESCKSTSGSFKVIRISTFTWCSGLSSGIQYRPISVTVDATNWKQYTSGVLNNCGTSINHAVLLVGVIDGNWKIKNSWGLSWGESGYIRLAQGNTCGVCQYPGVYGNI